MSFRTSLPLLERHVLRESILPFFLGFFLVTFLFVLDFLFDFLDLLLAKDVPPLVVGELFLLALGWIMALSVPCGVLVAALMTFGRLAQDNEITAMRALGVNLARVLRGPAWGAVVLAGLLVLFNNYVLPETNHRFAMLRYAIHRKAPAAKIEPGIFINAFDNYSLLVREVDNKTGEMKDITIYDYTDSAVPTTIIAKEGTMQYKNHSTVLRLDLRDGEIHSLPGAASEGNYRRAEFKLHTLYLYNSNAVLKRPEETTRQEREMNINMMLDEIAKRNEQKEKRLEQLETKAIDAGFTSPRQVEAWIHPPTGISLLWSKLLIALGAEKPPTFPAVVTDPEFTNKLRVDLTDIESLDRRIDQFKVEVHKKFSIPFACLVFVMVGGPLGIRTRKGGFANMAIAVAFFIIYYLFLIAGESLADRRFVSPALAMWAPNIFFGLVAVYLTASVVGIGPSRGMR